MTDDIGFCTSCGAELDPNAVYCPACGIPTSTEAAAKAYEDGTKALAEVRIFKASLYLVIATLPSLILGIYFLTSADALAETAMKTLIDTFGIDFVIDNDITTDMLRDTYVTSGWALIGIAAIGLIGALMCYKKMMYWVVLIISMIVLIAGVTTIIGLIVGILALWNIMSSKPAFDRASV